MAAFTAPHVAWTAIAPVVIVLGAGVVGVLVEAFVPARLRRPVQLALAIAAPAAAVVAVAALWSGVRDSGGTSVLGGSVLVDGPTLVAWLIIAALGLLSVLLAADRTEVGEDAFAPAVAAVPGSAYEEQARAAGTVQTEIFPLMMFALGGMMAFPAAGDLLTLFVALEVLSLPLYLLAGTARRRRLLSQEASMKYFLLGAFASALFLFGIALIYGYAGSIRFSDITAATATPSQLDPLLLVGLLLLLAGLLFKTGAVPFHLWTPDVYQGAPTPITAFMAACTKVAAFGALLRVVYAVFPGLHWDINPLLWIVAIATMVVGTVAALVQNDVKRLLAYSSIAHAGFVLTGIAALHQRGIAAVLIYLLAYGAATVGAFGIVALVRERSADGSVVGEAGALSQWAGIGRSHPVLAVTFTLFLLSFAGIPLTAGFIGKFAVFSAAVAGGAWPLALIGVLASAAAAFFYVRIIVLMFFTDAQGEAEPAASASAPAALPDAAGGPVAVAVAERTTERTTTTVVVGTEGFAAVAIAVCAIVTLVVGLFPTPVLDLIGNVAKFLP
ncbi:MAG: NADH-quinone oxidoreductase subunit N [Cellulomonas sp. 73-92]|uniref:NADH-quinone oxidoreductase subunit NuoN n=1 Tax=Cellulomonas sp. 73-92 TaxID=1895740 RepID=UPI000926EAD2|nr:NADH-quinone oxidoreductase subunit NuoN [Cellulomonas sp. 73-92]OJV82517.1 MAG: NADH-quinone oxidoreductase subunit N [Cellulomonas sp. 73-92]